MKKFAAVLIILFTSTIFGCSYNPNDIDMKKVSEIQIMKWTPREGAQGSGTGDRLAAIKEKSEIISIIDAIEKAKKETSNLGYEEKEGTYYEIKFLYEGSPRKGFVFWVEEDWDKAVYVNRSYYHIDEEVTRKLKDIIFK